MGERDEADERFEVPGADVLFEDTWGAETSQRRCERCETPAGQEETRCPSCGILLPFCYGACGTCGFRSCVGGKRGGR